MSEEKTGLNVGDENQFVIFSLEFEEFGIEIMKVREIIRLTSITRLPRTPDFVEGVINLRGEVIPVLNLRKRFDIEEAYRGMDARIVIVEVEDSLIGFMVDAVSEVLRISSSHIDPPPSNMAGLKTDYIEGVGKIGDRLLVILKIEKLLTSDERIKIDQLQIDNEQEAEVS